MKILIALLLTITNCFATDLILIGGGKRPKAALKYFVSKVKTGPIVVLPWGTSYPMESFETIKAELKEVGAKNVICFCDKSFTLKERSLLQQSGGIYFPGGNQNKVMKRIKKNKIKFLIRSLYKSGIPVAGTSAGTAIQSNPMLTGSGSETTEGLGLLRHFIVDQHFIVRNREDRLLGALEENTNFHGMGVDEDMSAVIQDNKRITALGPTFVNLYLKQGNSYKMIQLSNKESMFFEF
jgi:cyanophycinase